MKNELTLAELQAIDTPVVYITNETRGEGRSQIVLNVNKASGIGVETLIIAPTWVPQELTGQIPKNILLNSSDFRRAVTNGWIRIISEEYAADMLKQPGAKEELDKVTARNNSTDITSVEGMSDITVNDVITDPIESQEASIRVSPSVMAVFGEFENDELSELEVLNALRNLGDLNNTSLNYVRTQAKQHKLASVRDWVLPQLNIK